jgi:glyoxylase-like metal-dependent hydrolase (beta-lactamase superfamily II)
MREDGIDPASIGAITNTHLHGDHCAANEDFKRLSGASITIHPVQKEYYPQIILEGVRHFGMSPMEFKEDSCLENSRLSTGGIELELIRAPGHSPDCVCFYRREDKVLICGDVIFNQNTGRVDLPGSSAAEMKKSIDGLAQLEIEYLLPGHMEVVAGAKQVRHNFDFIRENIYPWL